MLFFLYFLHLKFDCFCITNAKIFDNSIFKFNQLSNTYFLRLSILANNFVKLFSNVSTVTSIANLYSSF